MVCKEVRTGIEIPDELVRAHEEGDVVFFCGAGISYDAGLPLFGGLLEETAKGVNHELSPSESRLFKEGKYDHLYQMIERAIGGKERVRRVSEKKLRPLKVDDESLALHKALLTLSKSSDGRHRLVTTNYDCLFSLAAEKYGFDIREFAAPLLPVPKKYKFDGIVYLHGKLEENPSSDNLNSLVLSSGDFGLAYLNERWAARFVSELFREFTVCFVGYSVNDVIIRYMIDALSSETMLGANNRKVYAFSGVRSVDYARDREAWEAKGIIPIQYRITKKRGHRCLRDALSAWGQYHADGRLGKAAVVRELMSVPPDSMTRKGLAKISRVRWALADVVGAKALDDVRDERAYLWIEHLTPELANDEKVGRIVMSWIGKWIPRVESLRWCLNYQQVLTDSNLQVLERHLENAVFTDPRLSCLWRLYLSSSHRRGSLFLDAWLKDVAGMGRVDSGHREWFEQVIHPTVSLSQKVHLHKDVECRCQDAFSWELVIGEGVCSFDGSNDVNVYLAELLPEIASAVFRAGAIMSDLSEVRTEQDLSYFHVPSMLDGRNCYRTRHWSTLLLLLRDGFMSCVAANPRSARHFVKQWGDVHYPVFYRVFLFAATNCPSVSTRYILGWLKRNPEAIWYENCERELYEFLDSRASSFTEREVSDFESMLFAAETLTDCAKASRLEHLVLGHAPVSSTGREFVRKISSAHQGWNRRLRPNDGLRVVEDVENDGSVNCTKGNEMVPTEIDAAQAYLVCLDAMSCGGRGQAWRTFCSEHSHEAFKLLCDVGREKGSWPSLAWSMAFECFRSAGTAKSIAGEVSLLIAETLPVELLGSFKISLAFWMQTAAKAGAGGEGFVRLCARFILEVPAEEQTDGTENNNAPYELAMESILRAWFGKPGVRSGSGIPEDMLPILNYVADEKTLSARYANRTVMQQLSELYIIDPDWTRLKLLPKLSWSHAGSSPISAWNNAVMSSRYVGDFMREIGDDFLETGRHYELLDGFSKQWYCAHFLRRCMPVATWDRATALSAVIRELPSDGRVELMRQIYVMLQSAQGHSDEVWNKEVHPFLKNLWPGERHFTDDHVSQHLISAIAFLDQEFEKGVRYLQEHVKAKIPADYVVQYLVTGEKGGQGHCAQHPAAALAYLGFFSSFGGVGYQTLKRGLDEIASADPSLASTREYRNLLEHLAERRI